MWYHPHNVRRDHPWQSSCHLHHLHTPVEAAQVVALQHVFELSTHSRLPLPRCSLQEGVLFLTYSSLISQVGVTRIAVLLLHT
jgi:hypothetical protein